MDTPSFSEGDLGDYIIAELSRRGGFTVSGTRGLPRLPATWHTVTVELAGVPRDVGASAQGCSFTDVSSFCFLLFAGLRQHRPLSEDNDERFVFTIGGGDAHFQKTSTELAITFIKQRMTMTIAEYEHGLHIGFAEYGPAA